MFGVNGLNIELYFVGYDIDNAKTNFPFDSLDSAQSYANDNPGMKIFVAQGMVDLNTLEEV